MSLSKPEIFGVNNTTCHRNDEDLEISVPIRNMAEYKKLIDLADEQLKALQKTMDELYRLDVIMKLTF